MSDEAERWAERWRALNRANWDERTGIHLGPNSDYDLASLRSGRGRLHPIEDAELGDVRQAVAAARPVAAGDASLISRAWGA